METPIYDFLKSYSESNVLRRHMPGHKGRKTADLSFAHDITEIKTKKITERQIKSYEK